MHGQLCIGARGYLTISIRDALWLSSRGLDYLFTWDTDLCPRERHFVDSVLLKFRFNPGIYPKITEKKMLTET